MYLLKLISDDNPHRVVLVDKHNNYDEWHNSPFSFSRGRALAGRRGNATLISRMRPLYCNYDPSINFGRSVYWPGDRVKYFEP